METFRTGDIILKNPVIDLRAMLVADFVHTNVNAAVTGDPLTADPSIRYRGENDPDTPISNGQIELVNERAEKPTTNKSYQSEIYLIECKLIYEGVGQTTTDPEIIKAMLSEIERIFNAENVSNTRTYDWQLDYGWRGSFLIGIIDFIVTAVPLNYAVSI